MYIHMGAGVCVCGACISNKKKSDMMIILIGVIRVVLHMHKF